MNIYVGNIPFGIGEDELRTIFTEFGAVASVKIISDRMTGKSRGFGFVEMENKEDGEKAITGLDGSEMGGRKVVVNEARPRERRES